MTAQLNIYDTVPPAGPLPEQPPEVALSDMDKFNTQIEHYYLVFYDLKFYSSRVVTSLVIRVEETFGGRTTYE